MPIHLGKDSKGPFVQWGHQKKYHYKANDKQSLANAKSRAKKQMKAIFSSGYVGQSVNDTICQDCSETFNWETQVDYYQDENGQLVFKCPACGSENLHQLENNSNYINQDINYNIIQQIKNKLLNIFHKNTWKQFIDSQKYGDCQKIACYVAQLFPNIQIIEVEQNFCQEAINKLHALNDNVQMYGSHFLNKINNKYYDFGKGTNTILNVYLIGTQIQKYKVQLEENELNCFQSSYNRAVTPYLQLKKNVPQYLYHATYRPLLRKIKQLGLGNTKRTYWADSKPGVVYLADDPDVAESYADTNQNLRNEDWLDEIIILKINTDLLDKSKLFVDQNVKLDKDQLNTTWQYHEIIPWKNIEIFQQNTIYQSKFDKLFNLILQEIEENNIYYHISPFKFNNFELNKCGSGMNTSFWGYGIYFCKNDGIINYYYDQMKDNYSNLYKYTVKINCKFYQSTIQTCLRNEKLIYKENDLLTNNKTVGEIYYQLAQEYEQKKASQIIFNDYNVAGIQYYTEEDGQSLVIYDQSIIQILNIQEIHDKQ